MIKDKSEQAHVMSTELNDIEEKMAGGFCDCDCCLTSTQQFFSSWDFLLLDTSIIHVCVSVNAKGGTWNLDRHRWCIDIKSKSIINNT